MSSTMNPVESSAVPSVAASERDAERLTLSGEQYGDLMKEKIEEPASLQAAGLTACSVGQVGDDEFVEGGFEGWKVILGCALIGAPTIGWNLLWGVFQAYHSKFLLKGTPDATLSAVGSVQNALMTGLAFVTGKLGDRYGYRRFIAVGCITVFLGQFCASWCHDLWSIFLTQGVMQGIGCGLLLPMVFAIPSQWFRRHRGVASGVVIAGASLGGAVASLILQAMLGRLGFHKTLLIYSFVQGITMLVGFSLIKTRFPTSQLQNKNRKIVWMDKQYFKDPKFWSFWAALLFAVFGYMTPFVYISVYTREKIPQISDQLANLPIPIMAFASTIGRTTVGLTGDRIGFLNAFVLVILISSFCQAVLWNVAAESYAGIMVFSVLFGLTGPCILSLVTPVAVTLYGTHNLATLVGLLNLSNMPGSLAGPPLGGVILEKSGRNWHALTAYSGVIQFVGVLCMLYGMTVCL
ncbi:Monocarboxylate transporter 10 OS=Rattus norvegicus GN=Slc16a10 PE=1 SV=1 [Rhizoctonia solani AG-1 IB]|uniref:Monocarboxylate transporter 10 n=1 Tax=Thanatephorus cucumeris (strain AG1-IB / isolate 7/3/14) TaxID=1108050 RepID=A0A0B7FQX9_THACB|nr:Monocarboxylate transporter 10 OS=Rattus norvegicus GN=Slc16a10 PE=1 SV=1 [Rhizoctonia solani AG-1 IB]